MLEERLLDHQATYIVGVSGGCDSMALLDLLVTHHYHVIVAHVNYQLRNDTELDYQVVHDYCQSHEVPFHYKEVSHDDYQEGNFQAIARNIRYQFYQELYKQYHASGVILGHHFDDHVETIYMYLERGSESDYIGIQEKSIVKGMMIIRPLLHVYKRDLRSYCEHHQIAYHDDYTNFQTDFTRDLIRNTILNTYSDEEKQALALKAKALNKKRQEKQEAVWPLLVKYHQQGKISLDEIDEDLLYPFLYNLLKEAMQTKAIKRSLIEEVIHQIHSPKPNITFALSIHLLFIKEYNNIYVQTKHQEEGYSYQFDHLEIFDCDHFHVRLSGPLNNGVHVDEEDFPLTIRTFQSGDRIKTKGGTKKVSRLFIDHKIPAHLRKSYPLLCNAQGEIILIPEVAKRSEYTTTNPNVFVIK